MKNQVSPAVMAIVIVVVVALVGFIGFKYLGGTKKAESSASNQDKMKEYQASMEKMKQGGNSAGRTPMSRGSMSGGMMSGGR